MSAVATEASMQALLTRPRAEAHDLAIALAARGIAAIIAPVIEIDFCDRAGLDLAGVQAVLCTSANGVRALARSSREREIPIFAVGAATAARARGEGYSAVTAAGGDVGDLARLAAARLRPERGRLIHAAGSDLAGDLAGTLRRIGFDVVREILYCARPVSTLPAAAEQALRTGKIGFALFFSPRSAAIFVGLAIAVGIAECCGAVAALSLSDAVDAAIGGLPWKTRRVASHPTQPALLEGLDDLVDESRRGGAGRPADRKMR